MNACSHRSTTQHERVQVYLFRFTQYYPCVHLPHLSFIRGESQKHTYPPHSWNTSHAFMFPTFCSYKMNCENMFPTRNFMSLDTSDAACLRVGWAIESMPVANAFEAKRAMNLIWNVVLMSHNASNIVHTLLRTQSGRSSCSFPRAIRVIASVILRC